MAEDREQFAGEEGGTGFASPILDLAASLFLIALALLVMVESLALRVFDSWVTAPGLLPFLTGASLMLMALVLAWSAIRRWRAGFVGGPVEDLGDPARTVLLVVIVACYLAALELLGFNYQFLLMGFWLTIGSFELVSTIVLSVLLAIFWKGPIWACVVISAGWILVLAGTFRYVFNIPLPG